MAKTFTLKYFEAFTMFHCLLFLVLGHIIDIVQDACQGDLNAFASKNKITQFNRSINHPKVMGLKARHAISQEQPPPKPMSFEEACLFAKGIGRAWIESLEYES